MQIQRVLIAGAGWTGRQIAGQMAAFGVEVTLFDRSDQALQASRDWIESQAAHMRLNGFWPADETGNLMNRLQTSNSLQELRSDFDLVLESVSEQFSLKRRLMKQLSEQFPAPTILASNSSYFVPSMLEPHLNSPERFAHYHFHVPIWIATLVDIVPGSTTHPETLERLVELSARIGQTPLVQTVENPGYVFNWMLKALLQSALQLVHRQVATPADIEMVWKKVTGMPIGPFGIMDQIGVDLIEQTMSHARFVDGDDAWQPLIDLLKPYIENNQLGVKTGRGFFEYQAGVIDRTQPVRER
jgi:3-hydroxybutyryl-CoA dehydrogenase